MRARTRTPEGMSGVEMEEAEQQSDDDGNGSICGQREQPDAEVAQAQTEVEANLAQLPDARESHRCRHPAAAFC